jgi:TrpR-related protein YerC/YecD
MSEQTNYPTRGHKELFEAILKLKNPEEAMKFFRDLLTIAELDEFANRFQMAKKLYKGVSYIKVAKETKSSTTTVARVAHWLFRGMGGYKLILDRIQNKK